MDDDLNDDIFDTLLSIEADLHQEGRDEGMAIGCRQGRAEGVCNGVEKGLQIAEEIGHYRGCALVWLLELQQAEPGTYPRRAQRTLEKLLQHTQSIPAVQDESFTDFMEKGKIMFKQANSLMGGAHVFKRPDSMQSY